MLQQRLHQLFILSVVLKGLHAAIELAGGIALYLFSTNVILAWLWEAGRSSDWIARFAHGFSPPEHEFYAFYLVSHGIINGTIVAGLLLGKRWSYHATFVVLTRTLSDAAKVNAQSREPGVVQRRGGAKHDFVVHRAAAEWMWMKNESHGSRWALPGLLQNSL